MVTAAICHHRHDSVFAAEAAGYLNLHTSLHCEPADCAAPEDFLDLMEQCLTKQFMFVVLSSASVPNLWPRPLWEPVLLESARESESHIAFIALDTCAFPPILKRRNFFDLTQNPTDGLRVLRRWAIKNMQPERTATVAGNHAEPKNPPLFLIDEPGIEFNVKSNDAAWMMANCWHDFEGIYLIPCAHRSRAGVLGDLAHQMKLRLPGTLAHNWSALKAEAASQRSLYVFEHLPEEFSGLAELGGKASVLVTGGAEPTCVSFSDLHEIFFIPQSDATDCLRALDAFCASESLVGNWPDAYSIALRGLTLLKQGARLAEAHELLKWMAGGAKRAGDARALDRIRWEEIWILESWDLTPYDRDAMTQTQPAQLALPLWS
jgi:hypothetical protein